MSKEFVNHLSNGMNVAYTENGAQARATTNSNVLDLFSKIGALRNGVGAGNSLSLFRKAFSENPLLTLKALFWARDIRGGAGERETFKIFMKDLVKSGFTSVIKKNLHLIPEYGRWDDLWMFLDEKELKNDVIQLVKNKLKEDSVSKNPSLLAKWLPSENTSSKETVRYAKIIIEGLGITPRQYRKILSKLRNDLNIVEKNLTQKKYSNIVYEHVPSRASLLYKKAFTRHDQVRYTTYLQKVLSGEKKINSAALFPYEIVKKYTGIYAIDATLEALWKNLPNYIQNSDDSLVVADVSGSMQGIPMDVCISLALYIAERNHGCWKDKFITFSENPSIQSVIGNTLFERIRNLSRAHWGMSTNIEKVFDILLKTGKENHLPKDKMIKKVIIISDMEFNQASGRIDEKTLFQTIKKKWEKEKYEMPELVFWNVRASREQYPMAMGDGHFTYVSGSSPAICRYMFTNVRKDAYELMLEVLESERYSKITV